MSVLYETIDIEAMPGDEIDTLMKFAYSKVDQLYGGKYQGKWQMWHYSLEGIRFIVTFRLYL